jgi:alpha-methylacyl-CoA racemase
VPQRGADLLTGGDAGYGVYATADGRYMAVAPLEKKFWDLFCDALARPEWKSKHALRGAAAAALRRELEALFASRNQAEWQDFFTGVDCCVTPILNVAEALEHPQFVARRMAVQAHGVTQFAPPLKLSGWVFAVERVSTAARRAWCRGAARVRFQCG